MAVPTPRAMILAAGRGERMRPLTDHFPKPLLIAGGRPLIEWTIQALTKAGIRQIVINHAHLGEQFERVLGDGSRFGVSIRYSAEPAALETAGGIKNALSVLGDEPFIVVNGDIYTEFDFRALVAYAGNMPAQDTGLCVLVPNPPHHPGGDFALQAGRLTQQGDNRLTYAGIAVYRPDLFASLPSGAAAPLGPLLRAQADANKLAALRFTGLWLDIGTPDRLRDLDQLLQGKVTNEFL